MFLSTIYFIIKKYFFRQNSDSSDLTKTRFIKNIAFPNPMPTEIELRDIPTEIKLRDMGHKALGLDVVLQSVGDPRAEHIQALCDLAMHPENIVLGPRANKGAVLFALFAYLKNAASDYGYDSGQRYFGLVPIEGSPDVAPTEVAERKYLELAAKDMASLLQTMGYEPAETHREL